MALRIVELNAFLSSRGEADLPAAAQAAVAVRQPTQALGVAAVVVSATDAALTGAVRGPAHAAAGRQHRARRAVGARVPRAVRQRDVVAADAPRVKDATRAQQVTTVLSVQQHVNTSPAPPSEETGTDGELQRGPR
jgi:hypothetical protein